MSLTRRIHKGGMKTKGKKGKGHCNKGGKTMKKGGRNVLVPLAFLSAVLASGKSKNPRKSRKSRKSRKGGTLDYSLPGDGEILLISKRGKLSDAQKTTYLPEAAMTFSKGE